MKVMSDSLMELAGNRMRSFLATMTSNRFLGISTGFLITAVIQSSSATTLMVVSFANASLLSLTESISVIMGANIGTTITAWLISLLGFKVSMNVIALPLVGLGFGMTFAKKPRWRQTGNFIIGFGLLFVGLQFLKEAMPDIDGNPEILSFLRDYTDMGFGSVLLFLLIGSLLTIVIQSSSATMALTLVMTAEGWIPYELAAAMVLGENIGTTVTANIAAFVSNFRARQTAMAHLIFNILGVVWMLIFFFPFLRGISRLTQGLGSASPYVDAAAIPVAVSLFHTCFNITNTLLMVWFVHPIARLVARLVPERVQEAGGIEEPKFLSREVLKYPQTAIVSLERESAYLFENAIVEIVAHAVNLHRTDIFSDTKARQVVQRSQENLHTDVRSLYKSRVKRIYSEIVTYIIQVQGRLNLTPKQHRRVMELYSANRKMVEVIRNAGELNRNMNRYLGPEFPEMAGAYEKLRKQVVKVLRAIRGVQTGEDPERYFKKMLKLSQKAEATSRGGNLEIDQLIREDKITPEQASSLVNDSDIVSQMIQDLLVVAELLYGHGDVLSVSQHTDIENNSALI